MKLAWLTDIHLNFLTDERVIEFGRRVAASGCDAVFITGDISEAPVLKKHLQILEATIQKPIYFVLGNHDFWGGSVARVRNDMIELSRESKFLSYLPASGVVSLTPKCALIGHDGWYDAGYGDWKKSNFYMMDWQRMHDFLPVNSSKALVVSLSKTLAMEACAHIENNLNQALVSHDHVIIATHVPPWSGVAVHKGQPQDASAAPWFTCKMMSESIGNIMNSTPDPKRVIVFAGHTHGRASGQPLRNVVCHVGGAEYNSPEIQQIIQV